jgi:hypothetical protein
VVASLFGGKTGDGREYTECIAGKHDDVAGLTVDNAGNFSVGDVFDGVGAAGVFCDADIIIIWNAGSGVVDNVFEDRTISNGVVDIRLLLGGEVDALGVTTTLNVEDTSI